jgi:hypothetical protein
MKSGNLKGTPESFCSAHGEQSRAKMFKEEPTARREPEFPETNNIPPAPEVAIARGD